MIITGAIFDLDGVISKTEVLHASAWKKLFDNFLKARLSSDDFLEFDLEKDYLKYVDGRPRLEGINTFLASRGIKLEQGDNNSAGDFSTVTGLGLIKDDIFRRVLSQQGVSLYSSTILLIDKLASFDIPLFVASSSKNCRRVLEVSGLRNNFLSIFDGVDLEKYGLKGKPHPDLFLKVIDGFNLEPKDCVVFEDSLAGVMSAKSGGFYTVGIDRATNSEFFKKEKADLIINDLSQLDFSKGKGLFLK